MEDVNEVLQLIEVNESKEADARDYYYKLLEIIPDKYKDAIREIHIRTAKVFLISINSEKNVSFKKFNIKQKSTFPSAASFTISERPPVFSIISEISVCEYVII